MIELINQVTLEAVRIIARFVTGKLYTEEEIKKITSGATGRYFAEFFPTPRNELAARERIDSARRHIESAGSIIRDMQDDLDAQDRKLGDLLVAIEEKKQLADRYQALTGANQEVFDAFRTEMEDALRKQLEEQADSASCVGYSLDHNPHCRRSAWGIFQRNCRLTQKLCITILAANIVPQRQLRVTAPRASIPFAAERVCRRFL